MFFITVKQVWSTLGRDGMGGIIGFVADLVEKVLFWATSNGF